MGLFNNYTRPGPGVEKDAPRKKWFFRYFEIFFRKIWKIWKINMLTFLASLPFLAIMFIIAPVSVATAVIGELPSVQVLVLRSFFAITMFTLFGSGPASAAYAYITRCFTREEHAWLWSDSKEKFKENFKQSMILTVIDIVGIVFLMTGLDYYYSQFMTTHSSIWLIAEFLMVIVSAIFLFMNFHTYQLMVTFETTTPQLLKNSVMFSLAQLPMNMFLLILGLGINILIFLYFPFYLAVLFSFLIGTSLVRFPIEYSSARAIEKKLLANIEQQASSQSEGEE